MTAFVQNLTFSFRELDGGIQGAPKDREIPVSSRRENCPAVKISPSAYLGYRTIQKGRRK
jgi:hypothetical protein